MKSRVNGVYNKYVKRIMDIVCCIFALILFGWLYLLIALCVYLKLGSPIIFRQKRPGKIDPQTGTETIFELYKFRSMSDARDDEGRLLPDADRLTKFGRFLRATSLDELPETFNILKGDMSIIGPRPWAVSYLKYYTNNEHRRHLVRPGLSGWAQVNGRTAATWDDRLKFDIEYVDNVSFFLDMKTILLTVKKVLIHSDIVEAGQQGDFSDYRQKQWELGTVSKNENPIDNKV